MRAPRSSSLRAASLWTLAAVVLLGALWRGGVRWQAQAATAAACALAVVLSVQRRSGRERSEGEPRGARLPWLVIGLTGATALVALQLLPLPMALVRLLSPSGADLQVAALEPLGLPIAFRPLSLDPGATALELAKLAAWTLATFAAAQLVGSRERRERLLQAVALAGVAVALASYGAAVAGVGSLLESRVTFINPNHLASFMLLTCWIALGLGLRSRGAQRVAWLGGFVTVASQVFLSLSRAGIAAFFVGAGVSAVLAIRTGHAARAVAGLTGEGAARSRRAMAAPVAIFAALAVAAWLALDDLVGQLRSLSEIDSDVKLSLWPLAWQALLQHPLVGIGRGAFATVFPAFKVEMAQVTFSHLENTWLQIPLDIGLPAGLALIVLLAWSWLTGARSAELSRPMIGALSGLAAVAAHDAFDFSLELSGIALPFLVLLVAATWEAPALRISRLAAMAAAVAGLLLAVLGLGLHLPHREERQNTRIAKSETLDEYRRAVGQALTWHPADWLPPALLGLRLVEEGQCQEAMAWLNRAMLRNPTQSQPHRAAGRCLAINGQDAAAKREFRLAYVYGDYSVLEEALDTFPQRGALLDVTPDTPDGLMAAAALLYRRVQERPDEAEEVYRRAWESYAVPAALGGLARAAMDQERPEEALELARQLQARLPAEPTGYLVAAEALVTLEREGEAIAELEKGITALPKRSELLFALGNRHLAEGRFSQAKLTFDRVVAREGRELAQKRLAIARTLDAQGRHGEALKEARVAQEAAPDDPGPLLVVARIASHAGLYDAAIEAVERAARLPRSIPGAYDDQLAALKQARLKQHLKYGSRPPAAQLGADERTGKTP